MCPYCILHSKFCLLATECFTVNHVLLTLHLWAQSKEDLSLLQHVTVFSTMGESRKAEKFLHCLQLITHFSLRCFYVKWRYRWVLTNVCTYVTITNTSINIQSISVTPTPAKFLSCSIPFSPHLGNYCSDYSHCRLVLCICKHPINRIT